MAKRITISQIKTEDITRWSKEDYETYLPQMIKKYNDRARSFSNKKNKNVFSYALDKMDDWIQHNTYAKAARGQLKMPTPTDSARRDFGRKQALAFKIQEFFKYQTSSVEGARKVARDQDLRLFGADARGNPVRRMRYAERQMFWQVYDEFLNQHAEWSDKSYRAQDVIASMVKDGSLPTHAFAQYHGYRGKNFQSILDEAARRYEAGNDEEDVSPWHGEKATGSVTKRYGDTVLKRGRHGR